MLQVGDEAEPYPLHARTVEGVGELAARSAARAALREGATCFTHLFNAMSPMLNRAPGVTGACINSTAYAGIICDGIHVADEMVGLAIRARPVPGRMFLVSDAMCQGALGLSTGLFYAPQSFAKSDEVVTLAKAIQTSVYERFGIRLEPEPVVL